MNTPRMADTNSAPSSSSSSALLAVVGMTEIEGGMEPPGFNGTTDHNNNGGVSGSGTGSSTIRSVVPDAKLAVSPMQTGTTKNRKHLTTQLAKDKDKDNNNYKSSTSSSSFSSWETRLSKKKEESNTTIPKPYRTSARFQSLFKEEEQETTTTSPPDTTTTSTTTTTTSPTSTTFLRKSTTASTSPSSSSTVPAPLVAVDHNNGGSGSSNSGTKSSSETLSRLELSQARRRRELLSQTTTTTSPSPASITSGTTKEEDYSTVTNNATIPTSSSTTTTTTTTRSGTLTSTGSGSGSGTGSGRLRLSQARRRSSSKEEDSSSTTTSPPATTTISPSTPTLTSTGSGSGTGSGRLRLSQARRRSSSREEDSSTTTPTPTPTLIKTEEEGETTFPPSSPVTSPALTRLRLSQARRQQKLQQQNKLVATTGTGPTTTTTTTTPQATSPSATTTTTAVTTTVPVSRNATAAATSTTTTAITTTATPLTRRRASSISRPPPPPREENGEGKEGAPPRARTSSTASDAEEVAAWLAQSEGKSTDDDHDDGEQSHTAKVGTTSTTTTTTTTKAAASTNTSTTGATTDPAAGGESNFDSIAGTSSSNVDVTGTSATVSMEPSAAAAATTTTTDTVPPPPSATKPDNTDYGPAISEAIQELEFLSQTSRLKQERMIPQIRWKFIQMGEILGLGGFSQVNRAHITNAPNLDDGHYALKCLDDRFLQQKSKKHIIEAALDIAVEGEILSRLHHPNIITLYGTSTTNLIDVKFSDKGMRDYFLLLDVLEETLYDRLQIWRRKTFLKSLVGRPLSKKKMLDRIETAAIGVARGMLYLHEKKVVLRDLKPENVGFDAYGVPKLFDFGFAREAHNVRADEIAGSHCYMAPEMTLGLGSDITADVYSFGVVLWELTSLQKPYEQFKMKKGFRKANRVNYSFRPSVDCIPSPGLRKLIKECWSFRSTDRPDFRHVIKVLEVVPMEVYDRAVSSSSLVLSDEDSSHGAATEQLYASAHFGDKISNKDLGMGVNDGPYNEEHNLSVKSDTMALGLSYMTNNSPIASASAHGRRSSITHAKKTKDESSSFDNTNYTEPRDKDLSSLIYKQGSADETVLLGGAAKPSKNVGRSRSASSASSVENSPGKFKKSKGLFRTWSLSSGKSDQGDASGGGGVDGEPKEKRRSGVFTRGVFRNFSSSSSNDGSVGRKKRPTRRGNKNPNKEAREHNSLSFLDQQVRTLSTEETERLHRRQGREGLTEAEEENFGNIIDKLLKEGKTEETAAAAKQAKSPEVTKTALHTSVPLSHPPPPPPPPVQMHKSPTTSAKIPASPAVSHPKSKVEALERELEETTDEVVSLQAEKNTLASRIESIDAALANGTEKHPQKKKRDLIESLTAERQTLAERLETVEEDISDKAIKLLDIQDELEKESS